MKGTVAVVVTYNRLELLKECLAALERETVPCNVFVVDNASTDGTTEWLAEYVKSRKSVHCRTTERNVGGAGGFNLGIRWATEAGYDFVWVMDDDCIPDERALEELLAADRELSGCYGFLSSRVLWRDGTLCTMNVQRKTPFKDNRDFDGKLVRIAMASFVSLFIPVPVVKKVGLPIKEFFIWTDDWEYTRRISRLYPCYLANRSVVTHKSKVNAGADIATENADRLYRFNYLYRNDVCLYRREGLSGLIYELLRLTWHSARVILNAKGDKILRLKTIWRGTAAGLAFAPAIEYVDEEHKPTYKL